MRDPKQRQGRRQCGPGDKVLVPVGHRKWVSNKGTAMLTIRHVCVRDLADAGTDAGATIDVAFPTDGPGAGFLDDWALAMGRSAPYDPEEDDDVQAIMAAGAVGGKVTLRQYNGKDVPEARIWWQLQPAKRDSAEWVDLIARAEQGWREHMRWRTEQGWEGGNGGTGGDEWGEERRDDGWGPAVPDSAAELPGATPPEDDIPF